MIEFKQTKNSLSNYHTHSVLCDGNDTMEEMVIKAISLGCPQLGFSGHGYTDFDESYCMLKDDIDEYVREIKRLRCMYGKDIEILAGIEHDYYSKEDVSQFDYVIGSVHYVYKDDKYIVIDEGKESFTEAVEKYYSGDYYAIAEDYFKNVGDVYRRTGCDIIGHFDLITKFNEGNVLFDTCDERYVRAYMKALDDIDSSLEEAGVGKDAVRFEINTGAMARGYRTEAYPANDVIEEIRRRGYRFILNSDCHNRDNLLYGFEKYIKYI
ncbi:MAG: histidinol-phosphatase [Eubacteriaceae bacterium]|nr:histidinol-phosphatase [Eubacteriaceae bacterium]